MVEQPLPCRETRDRQARADGEVDIAREGSEVARLDGHVLGQRAVTMPVRDAKDSLSERQPRRAVPEGGDHSGHFVARDRRCSVTVGAISPSRGPRQLGRDVSRCMNLNNDVVDGGRWLGPLHQRHPRRSRSLVRHDDRLHAAVLPSPRGPIARWDCCATAAPSALASVGPQPAAEHVTGNDTRAWNMRSGRHTG